MARWVLPTPGGPRRTTFSARSTKLRPASKGDSYRLREKKKAGLLGRKPKPAAELEEEEVGAEA